MLYKRVKEGGRGVKSIEYKVVQVPALFTSFHVRDALQFTVVRGAETNVVSPIMVGGLT